MLTATLQKKKKNRCLLILKEGSINQRAELGFIEKKGGKKKKKEWPSSVLLLLSYSILILPMLIYIIFSRNTA